MIRFIEKHFAKILWKAFHFLKAKDVQNVNMGHDESPDYSDGELNLVKHSTSL